ncbi:hypothetical protein [Agromyces sp. Marseille-P2726]|uniref:hypothetical protein n=1 Tax=Agromyces sp. Marseille-P2726 TaxID=2709132 RepID=UPI00156F9D13|nr:hypothetical protein [Agromyces sp. Marseille-P2726]
MTGVIRVLAILLGFIWLALGYGIVDLSVMLTWDVEFLPLLPLEASWGAVVTFFVAMPFVVVAVRPVRWADLVVMSALVVIALCIGSLLTGETSGLWLAAAVAVTGGGIAIPGIVGMRGGEFGPGVHWRPGLDVPFAVLAVAGIPLWGIFVRDAATLADQSPSDITLGIDHWPIHVAAGVLVPAGAVLAASVGRLRTLAAVATALTATCIGAAMAVSQSYPVATASAHWSVLVLVWGAAVLLAAMRAMALQGRPSAEPIQRGATPSPGVAASNGDARRSSHGG